MLCAAAGGLVAASGGSVGSASTTKVASPQAAPVGPVMPIMPFLGSGRALVQSTVPAALMATRRSFRHRGVAQRRWCRGHEAAGRDGERAGSQWWGVAINQLPRPEMTGSPVT
jgi:hypothetical protein